ncbi:unconventional myosin-XVIIIa isoform X7 [Ischnura elegans]|uniref:unconventional myosin-XVIIIa isoform X7 n=1 Tax=Ischnura elegans TaxID=197161 RepID=UPI001ED8B344|nr:unconventional myosin-XVIIIa isoform X7 [Ischnura elegans]
MLPPIDQMAGLTRRPPRPYTKRSATIANLPGTSPRRSSLPRMAPPSLSSTQMQNGPSTYSRARTPQRYPPRAPSAGGRWASPSPEGRYSTPPPYSDRSRSVTPSSSYFGDTGYPSRGYSPFPPPAPLSHSSSTESFPRRVFPQAGARAGEVAGVARDEPVVFDAAMTFLLGRTSPAPGRGSIPIRQAVRPTPSHRMAETVSSALSNKISDFLKRTDHVMDEWKRLGRADPAEGSGAEGSLGRSRSAANIAIKTHLRYGSECRSMRSMSRTSMASSEDPLSITELEDVEEEELVEELPLEGEEEVEDGAAEALTEMTADLAEEHSTSTLAAERLEAEAAERIRLEKELQESQGRNKVLQQSSERLEMELLFSRAAGMNGDVGGGGRGMGDDDEDVDDCDSGAALIYKQRYERAARELEFAKRRLQQQHEDDLEQLVGLKKQLEKKLTDAYEEVEEQRQVVGQWKRKSQKLTGEVNDLRLLLEEQNSRNVLLEKKQRKFDSELQQLQRELQQEKQNRERTAREKEAAQAELYTLEQSMSAMKLELELKDEKLTALTRELDELTFGGKTEEEVANLKKAKHELELKVKDQEEELDDLAGQVQLLEQAKLRLEMSLEQQRKEARREAAQRDEELEEARCNAHKKVKALEAQLEAEHEERTRLLRERHELERRLVEEGRGADGRRGGGADAEETIQRLRRDLRRTKALLRDAHTLLERSKSEPTAGKALLRSLRNQLEDAEAARQIAQKARQSAEEEAREAAAALEEALRQRSEAEEKAAALSRERADLRAQLEENEEEMAEMLKKYKGAVQQVSEEQAAMAEQAGQLSALEAERATLKEQVAELWARLEAALEGGGRGDPGANLAQRRLALKARDLESRLELEQTTRSRMEVQITRLKEAAEKATAEANAARARELAAQEALRRAQWAAREAREEVATAAARESEAAAKKREAEQRATVAEAESATTRADLRLALARLGDLQAAMRGEMGSGSSGGEEDDTESDSDTSEDMVDALLSNHRRSSNIGLKSKGSSSHVSLESDYGSYGVADGSLGSTRSPAEGAPSKESSA